MFKQEKGVTLVALVITIIVLLILAGVSIAMLTGDNGVLTKSQTAKEESAKAEIKEQVMMAINEIIMNANDVTNSSSGKIGDVERSSLNKATLENICTIINANVGAETATKGTGTITYKYGTDNYTVTLQAKTGSTDEFVGVATDTESVKGIEKAK